MPKNEPASLATQPASGRIKLAARSFACTLGVKPVTPPVIDRELTRFPPIERAAEVLRYSVLRAEYWLSPGGTLRAVLRLSLKLALLLGVPVLIVGPVVLLLLEAIAVATAALASIAANLAGFSVSLLIAVIGFAVLIALGRKFIRPK